MNGRSRHRSGMAPAILLCVALTLFALSVCVAGCSATSTPQGTVQAVQKAAAAGDQAGAAKMIALRLWQSPSKAKAIFAGALKDTSAGFAVQSEAGDQAVLTAAGAPTKDKVTLSKSGGAWTITGVRYESRATTVEPVKPPTTVSTIGRADQGREGPGRHAPG